MTRSALAALSVLAGAALGAGAVWLALPTPSPTPAREAEVPACPAPPPMDLQAIRAVVREELRAFAPPPAKPEPAPVEHAPSAGADAARHLVDGSLGRGAWTDADRLQLQALLPALSAAEREELQRKLVVAVNNEQIRVEVSGSLF